MDMRTVVAILLVAAPIGAVDVVYFHIWKFRLYQRRQSRREQVTHLARGVIFPVGLAILLIGRPEGAWFWFVLGLFVIDFCNTLLDAISEPGSRAPTGVPPAELALHYVGVTMMGAALAVYVGAGWSGRSNATSFVGHRAGEFPSALFGLGIVTVVAAAALVTFEAALFANALRSTSDDGGMKPARSGVG